MDVNSAFDLSPAEKLQLVQDLWDDLAANPQDVPLQDWQRAELEKRAAAHVAAPQSALTWEEVQRRICGIDLVHTHFPKEIGRDPQISPMTQIRASRDTDRDAVIATQSSQCL